MGECFFWYRPTRVVPDQRPLNGECFGVVIGDRSTSKVHSLAIAVCPCSRLNHRVLDVMQTRIQWVKSTRFSDLDFANDTASVRLTSDISERILAALHYLHYR